MTTNPYQSPQTPAARVVSPEAKAKSDTARNIRAICILYSVFGGFCMLVGIVLLLSGAEGRGARPPAVDWIFMIGGAVGLISAIGVLRKQTWGIPVCAIMSAFYMFGFPVGTILGGYFLLNIWKVKDQFQIVPAELA